LRVRSWPFRGSCAEGNRWKITLADRLRYRFDNTISRGTVALIGWLFVLLGALVFASSLIVYVTGVAPEAGGRRLDFLETLWLSLMRTIDPGGVGGDQGTWPFLLSMLAVTAGASSSSAP
jgi:ion channel POLLUX/CASTOR